MFKNSFHADEAHELTNDGFIGMGLPQSQLGHSKMCALDCSFAMTVECEEADRIGMFKDSLYADEANS